MGVTTFQRRAKQVWFVGVAVMLSLFLVFLTGEICVRGFFKARVEVPQDERCLTYRYDELLGWFPVGGSEGYFAGSRRIHVRHNARGFRDHEHGPKQKPRIVFLGDSFVWGYDVEQEERFTERLQPMAPKWEVINLGVSGYGTDQEFLLLAKNFEYYRPDVLFLIYHPYTDEVETRWNYVYDWYYKPYFVRAGEDIVPQGIPVPRSASYFFMSHPFLAKSGFFRACVKGYVETMHPRVNVPDLAGNLLDAMRRLCEDRRVFFAVGLVDDCPWLEKFGRENGIRTVNLKNPQVYPAMGGHWTPKGHEQVSQVLYAFLVKSRVLDAKPASQTGAVRAASPRSR